MTYLGILNELFHIRHLIGYAMRFGDYLRVDGLLARKEGFQFLQNFRRLLVRPFF